MSLIPKWERLPGELHGELSWRVSDESSFRMRLWMKWSAWLCLSLMLWTAAAESVHTHPNPTDASACSICVMAHASQPTADSAHSTPEFSTVGLLHEDDTIAVARISYADAGIRGPPVL